MKCPTCGFHERLDLILSPPVIDPATLRAELEDLKRLLTQAEDDGHGHKRWLSIDRMILRYEAALKDTPTKEQ